MNDIPPVNICRWSAKELRSPQVLTTPHATMAAFSLPYGEEHANEDALAIVEVSPEHHLLLLADGVGGLPAGSQASALAIDGLIEAIQVALFEGQPLQHGIVTGFDQANGAICERGGGGASTLAVVEVDHGQLRTYHAGDSGVLVTGQRGRLKLMTIAHSPVGYAQEAGYLTEVEAIHHEERHVVSNLLGSSDMRIEIGQRFELARFDTVVVGSDGLFDNLLSDEIANVIRSGDIEETARELAVRTRVRMEQPEPDKPSKLDDLSFILYRPRMPPRPRRRRNTQQSPDASCPAPEAVSASEGATD